MSLIWFFIVCIAQLTCCGKSYSTVESPHEITAEVSSRQVKIHIPSNHPSFQGMSPEKLEMLRPTWAPYVVKNTGVMRDENAGLVYTYALNTPLDQVIVRTMALNLARQSKTNATIQCDYDPNTETVFSFNGPISDSSQSGQKQCRYTITRAQEMRETTLPLIHPTTPQNTQLCSTPVNNKLRDELQSIVDSATNIPQHDQQIMFVIKGLQELLGPDFYNYKSGVWHSDLNDPLSFKQGDCRDYANMVKQMLDALGFKTQHAFIIKKDERTKDDVPMCETEEFRKENGHISQTPYHNILCIEKNNQNHWVDPEYSDDGALLSSPKKSSVLYHVPYTTEDQWVFKMTDQKFEHLPLISQGYYIRHVDLQNGKYFADPKGCYDQIKRPHGTFQTGVSRSANPLEHIKSGVDVGIDQGKQFSITFTPYRYNCEQEPKHRIKTVIKDAHAQIDTISKWNDITRSLYKVYNEGNNAVVELKNIVDKGGVKITKDHELTVFFIRPTQQKKAPSFNKRQTLSKQKKHPLFKQKKWTAHSPTLNKKKPLSKQKKQDLF